jgi:3'(2'), 5'-bisphosphate nucleotidase
MAHLSDQERFDRAQLRGRIAAIARRAGALIMRIYATDFTVRGKEDASPVTEADEAAEALILAELRALELRAPVVSEEAAAAGRTPEIGRRFWLVDPLDGTKEFISRNGEFTVNIALIEDERPTLGVVYAPALERLFSGVDGQGALLEESAGSRPIHCRRVPPEGLTVVSSRSHGDAAALDRFLGGRRVAASTNAGSSLKFCLVAAGEADLYPRLGRTMEWDTAAGDAVLRAAGGRVTEVDGRELRYGKPGFANPHFIADGLIA